MITEKRLSLTHNSFWSSAIPMASRYIRRRNLELGRWDDEFESALDENRGVINEAGFRLYAASLEQSVAPSDLTPESSETAVRSAVEFIRRFREFARTDVGYPSPAAVDEATALAERLGAFVERCDAGRVQVAPYFRGCGWVDECNGDLLVDSMLCEVKASEHRFRGRDLRQVLTYAALNFASREYEISSICLVNPRLGVFLEEDLESLCQELAGTSASEVLGEVVAYISQPNWRDEAV